MERTFNFPMFGGPVDGHVLKFDGTQEDPCINAPVFVYVSLARIDQETDEADYEILQYPEPDCDVYEFNAKDNDDPESLGDAIYTHRGKHVPDGATT